LLLVGIHSTNLFSDISSFFASATKTDVPLAALHFESTRTIAGVVEFSQF
jgi:hypothetical protein